MENQDISQIALNRIKENGIKPISRNIFSLKRVLFWSLAGVALIVGAVSFSVTLSILFNNDWELYNRFGLNFIFKTLPYFWAVCLIVFAIFGEFYYRKTLFGYRHRIVTIVGAYIILTVIFGSILNALGAGEVVEESISDNIPAYKGLVFNKKEFWSHPEAGLVAGKIISVDKESIKIMDLNDTVREIKIDTAIVGKQVDMKEGETIRIIGENDEKDENSEEDDVFTAAEIRPEMGHKFKKNNKDKKEQQNDRKENRMR
jgi:hypothetical protein